MSERNVVQGPDRLRAYKLARSLADQIAANLAEATCSPLHANQLRRSAESLVLNIAEGTAHFGATRRLYHYQTAHADAVECAAALTRLRRRNPKLNIFRARTTAEIIASMLAALVRQIVGQDSGGGSPSHSMPISVHSAPLR